jgi:hypothetical protein
VNDVRQTRLDDDGAVRIDMPDPIKNDIAMSHAIDVDLVRELRYPAKEAFLALV